MIYGIAGSSGSGKTTLAKAVAEKLGYEYVSASVTELAKEIGENPVSDMPLGDRIRFQAKLLRAMTDRFHALDHKTVWITDRTPLDTVGYVMAEVGMHSGTGVEMKVLEDAEKLVRAAQISTASLFDWTFITSPLGSYEEASTRPAANPAYQRHVHLLITGAALSNPRRCNVDLIKPLDLETRVAVVSATIRDRQEDLADIHYSRRLH